MTRIKHGRVHGYAVMAIGVACSACAHTVDVFVPVADVPPRTPIVAAITVGGGLSPFDDGRLHANGVVTNNGEVALHLAPTDLVVVEASDGDKFGALVVRHDRGFDALRALGLFVAIGGSLVSVVGDAACMAASNGLGVGCMFFGLTGAALSLVFGLTMVAGASNATLHVVETHTAPKVEVDLRGVSVRF